MSVSTPPWQRRCVHPGLWLLLGGLLLLLVWGLVEVGPWSIRSGVSDHAALNRAVTPVYLAAGWVALFAFAVLPRSKMRPWMLVWILVAGLGMRLICFSRPPQHETDFYRYLWEGAVTAHGLSPYTLSPNESVVGAESGRVGSGLLRFLTQEGQPVLTQVNYPHLRTIYPPLAQAVFAAAHLVAPWNPDGLRAVFLGLDILVVLLLMLLLHRTGQPLQYAAIYWWNPIAIKEFYIGIHMDGVALLAVLAVLAAALWRRHLLSLAVLGASLGTKLWPIVLGPVLIRRYARSWRQAAAGVAVCALVGSTMLWPLVASMGDRTSGLNAYLLHWYNNAGLFSVIHGVMRGLAAAFPAYELNPHALARLVTACLLALWLMAQAFRPVRDDRDLLRRCMLSVGGLFLLSPTQFPWYYTWLLPFLALSPSRPLLLYTGLLPLYHLHYDHPWVLWVEHAPVWLFMGWEAWRSRSRRAVTRSDSPRVLPAPAALPERPRIAVVIPALNEEKAIGRVLDAIPRWVHQVVVADNGSTDATAEVARSRGATVVREEERGYGAACLAGIRILDRPDIVVFLDGDFSDHPEEMGRLLEPILRGQADFVVGSRILGHAQPGSLTLQQRFGNALACRLLRCFFGSCQTDLGPFRAIRYDALSRLGMTDRAYGWTVQMQARGARIGLRIVEVPVSYRPRIGKSKISGTVRGAFGAGTKILGTILREAWAAHAIGISPPRDKVIVFARYPEAGRAKTRLIPLLGAEGAARLYGQLVRMTLETLRHLDAERQVEVEVRTTGSDPEAMAAIFGRDLRWYGQGDGDLGSRLNRAVRESFAAGSRRVVLVGTDCPWLTPERVVEAFDGLADNDVIVGPALDGGYYLIGLKQPHAALFEGIPWGGPEVLAQTLASAKQLRLKVGLLPTLADIDTPDDLQRWAHSRLASPDRKPRLSVIVPTRNEQDHLAATLASVLAEPAVEIIVADGQSTDRTRETAGHFGARVITVPPSRGNQLNAGAAHARADNLLFLHADTLLPPGYASFVESVLDQPRTAAGAFEFSVDAPGFGMRLVELGVHLRSRYLGLPYGDQAMFMPRDIYHRTSGFPSEPIMEDYAMVRRIRPLGQVRIAPARVITSGRRWQTEGMLHTTLRNYWRVLTYRDAGSVSGVRGTMGR